MQQQVLDGPLALWTPPAAGGYVVRLSVEDRAGNVARATRQVATAAPPDIADLTVAPRLVSPNGDGNADELVISYRVLRPILLRLEIHDADGRLVRAFDRSHPLAGEVVELRWDGRDGNGLPVPDGGYSVEVLGLELFFEVDRTPPEIEWGLSHGSDVPLTGSLSLSVRDEHLEPGPVGKVESGLGDSPQAWTPLTDLVSEQPERPGFVEEVDENLRLARASLLGRRFRIEATDAAGNRSVVVTHPPIAEEAFLVAAGPNRIDPETGSFDLDAVLSEGLHGPLVDALGNCVEPVAMPCFARLPADGAFRLRAQTTFAGAASQVVLQYRAHDPSLLGGGEEDLLWNERAMPAAFAPEGVVPAVGLPLDGFDLVWDLAGVDRSRSLVARLRVVDQDGEEHVTPAMRIIPVAPGPFFLGRLEDAWEAPFPSSFGLSERAELIRSARALAGTAGVDESRLLWGGEELSGELALAELFVQSADDGRYQEEARFEAVAIADGVFLFEVPTVECASYVVRLRAVDQNGDSYSSGGAITVPCMRLRVDLDPIPEPQCGATPGASSALGLDVTPESLDGATLSELRLELITSDSRELLDNLITPANGVARRFDLDLSSFPEGEYALLVSLINERDDVLSRRETVWVDRTPPTLEVTSPLEGQSSCGLVAIEGRAADGESPYALLLEPLPGSACSVSAVHQDSTTGTIVGLLGTLDGCQGEVGLRVLAVDQVGNTTCVDRQAVVDAVVLGGGIDAAGVALATSAGSVYQGLSPNGDGIGDGIADELEVELLAEEAVFADVAVHSRLAGLHCELGGTPVRTLVEGLPFSQRATVVWDGLDDGGQPVADGRYGVVAHIEDACGNDRTETFCSIALDASPPALEVTSPPAGAAVSGLVAVRGSVLEVRPPLPAGQLLTFDRFELDYQLDTAPGLWTPIHVSDVEVPDHDRHLATWRLQGAAGPVTLRLSASDLLGNRSEVTVPVQALDAPLLVSLLEPAPRLFSPNGDGRRDHVAIRLTLVEPVLVDLRILDGDGTLVRELVAGEALPAGAAVRIWDGLDDSGSIATDGTYEIEITARLASQPGISQTVRTQVVLDATPPAIQVLGPAGFADATATDVEIEVADANAGAWVVELAPEPGAGPPAWHQLAAGTGSIAAVVAQLAGLEEGSYRLRLEASDLAESTSSLESHFVVDGEPPVVHLLQPVEGGAFGGDLTVTASIDEEFLDRTRIELAPGADPNDEDFVLLVEAPAPSAGEFSSIVDVAGFADGGYVLRLVALDRSGNRGEARRRIRLDRSPPNADLSAPADGAWIREPVAIAGEASDANLASWTLTLAPAGGGGAPVELASGVTPVDAGDVLLTWAALPPDGEHLLRLTVTDHAGNQSIDSVTVAVDRAPPAPPTGFAGTVEGDDVQLSWQTSPEPDLAGYRLTRGGVVVAELGATETSAIDGGRFEGRYEYRLVAFDHAGNESSPAGPVSLVIDTTPPNASILRPRPGERVSGSVEIVGTAASAEDFLEYRLLIAVSPPPAEPILLRRSPAATTSGVLGLWDTSGAPEGEEVGLTLEAEDTSGNVARVSIVLTVDNEPPAVPEGLVASVAGDGAGDDVDLSWQANVESDLLGYVLLRDGVTIDALGRPTGGDLRDVALTGTSHRDADRPDGTFSYRVIAIDRAGNASAPSAPALATVETGAPVISIVEPTDGARVEGIVPVLVESPDLDVAEVRFEVRETGAPDWTLLGVDQEAPWGTEWDAAPLPFGLYELRATAVDGGGAEGPADLVTVELTELTPPPAPLALVLDVDGDEVSLSWPPVDTLDLAGYHVERSSDGGESWLRLDADPITATARADVGVADGTYRYRVVAADVNGNESDPSPEVGARVFGALLEQPLTPTAELAVGPVAGRGPDAVAYTVDPELEGPDGTIVPLASFASEADGSFVIPVVTLVRGRNVVRVRLTDDEGHRSRIGTVPIVSIAPPEAPAGLAATVDGFDVSLEWDPNPEPDLAGYLLRRGGEPVEPARLAPLVAAVDSQRGAEVAPLAIDGSSSTSWIPITPSSGGALEPPVWIEVELDRARVLTGVELEWYDASAAPRRARVEAHSGEVWATVATVPAATAVAEIAFVRPYATSRVRLIIDEAPSAFRRLWLRELRVLELGSIEGTSYGHIAGDGLHRYELQAIGASGLLGPSASLDVPVGDVVSPEPVILAGQASGFEVELSWTASPAPDVAGYTVYRDGSLIVRQLDAGFLAHTDGPLPNGSYRYRVTASDAVGNESASSNEVAIELAAPVPQPPTLAVTGTEASSATLSWTPSVGLEGVAFALERATSGGGPYEEVVLTTALTFTDEELDPATTYWYVVRAIDAAGNRSLPSNEVAVIAIDVTPPPAPRLFHPARPAGAIETGELLVDVAAFAERGARVSLWQGGSFRREATATSEWSDEPSSPSAERVRFSADGSRALAIDFDGVLWWLAFPLPSASPVATRVASAAWLGSESILYATGDGELRRFEPATGIASSIAAADEIAEVAAAEDPSSGEQLVLVTAERLGQAGLWRLDLASGGWELLEPLDHAYALWDLAIAPRLAHVAFLSEVHGLALLELSSGEITPLGGDAGGPVAWSPDGGALLYVEESAPSQIWRFELDSEVASQVTDDPDGAYGPLWSPDGSRYAYVRDGWGLQVVEWGGEAEEVAPYLPEVAVWTAGGAIGSHLDGGAVRILPPGLARWNGIGLEPGVNLLSARARDEAGLESPFSEVITVILRADALPDLELRSGELAAIPPTVEPLSPVRISAVVRNRGAQAAAASELELELEDPAGQSIWTRRLPVRALEPGGFATVLHDVALEVPGLYRLRARADAGLVVPEGDEANNQATRELRVLEAGAPLLSVSSEQLRYEPGELVRGEVRVLAGGAFAGRLVVRFEDELGFPVATLIDDVVALAFGQERIEMLAHESAGLFAGAYRLRARLEDEAGVAVAEQVASFEIGETIRAAAALEVTPQVAVRPGAVTLAGVLRYLEGNALLEDVELALVLLDPSGVEAARWEQTAGGLLPGDQAPLGVVWSSGGAAPGRWTATLTASFGSQQLASAEAMLDLGLAPPRAVGELSTSSEVAAGSTVDVDFLVRNVGELDLTGAQVTVSLRRAPPAGVHASESVVVDLPNGGTATGAVSLDSSGLGLGSYLIVFEADLEAAGDPGGATAPLDTVLLDTATVMLVDAETPEVELRQPVDGGFLGLDSRAVVRALDRLSGVASVEVVLDAGPPRPAFRIEGDLYGALLEGVSPLEEGVHTVEARTRDRAGNQAATGVLTFTVDRTPPEITVLGVVDGQVGGAPVVPVIEIVEEHPGTLSLLLDGLPFTSGDLVEAPGIHRLDVVTADLAGNRAAITVRFEITIPTGSPVLGEIVGAPAQAALGAPLEVVLELVNESGAPLVALPVSLSLESAASGEQLVRVELTLDLPAGATSVPDLSIDTAELVPEPIELVLSADLAQLGGGIVELDRQAVLLVDATPPGLELLVPADGAIVPAEVVVQALATDAHSPIDLVEVAFDGGELVALPATGGDTYGATFDGLAEGGHALVARALDAAGNAAEVAIELTVDATPPVVEVSGVVDGQQSSDPLTPVVTVTDPHLEQVAILLDGEPFASGTAVSAPGPHLLEVEALDLAGNRAELAVAFEILQAAPVLTATFAADRVGAGGTVELVYEITNASSMEAASEIGFENVFVEELPTAAALPASGFCGPGSAATFRPRAANPARLAIAGAALGSGESCRFSVVLDVEVGAAGGAITNTAGPLTATAGGVAVVGEAAADAVELIGAPYLTAEITDDPVAPGGGATLELTLAHHASAPGDATGIAFGVDLAGALAGLHATGLDGMGLPAADVCGAGSLLLGGDRLRLEGGVLAPGESCVLAIDLGTPASAPAGGHEIVTSSVIATVEVVGEGVDVVGAAAGDDLIVAGLTLAKEFANDPVAPGGEVTLRFTLSNTSATSSATEILFTDDLVEVLDGLTATQLQLVGLCGVASTLDASEAGELLVFQGGSLGPGESCSFEVTLLVPAGAEDGDYLNVTRDLSAMYDGSAIFFESTNAADVLVVRSAPLVLSKEIPDDPVPPGGVARMRFTLRNLVSEAAFGIGFSDDLDAALPGLAAIDLPLSACGGAVVEAATSGGAIELTGAELSAGSACSFEVTLAVPLDGPLATTVVNTTSPMSAVLESGAAVEAAPASDELQIGTLVLEKAFDRPAAAGGTVALTFEIRNLSRSRPALDLAFTDDLDATLAGLVATGLPIGDLCGAGSSIDGWSILVLSEGSLLPGDSCTFPVVLQVPAVAVPGEHVNVTGPLSGGDGATLARPAVAVLRVSAPADNDGDGVPDGDDLCAGTEIPEAIPTSSLEPNHYALVDGDGVFDTVTPPGGGPGDVFTIDDTRGCSCEQIIDVVGLGNGHRKHGCSLGAMRDWVADVEP
ncbi:MAG TPA: FlgD immunoglobulin-like domain containing protein [Thermoanaerobaculia bacterium]|nr:FlgD immunoglobulin-like domain containing protein [Thermoanaerobaculia bacterium]